MEIDYTKEENQVEPENEGMVINQSLIRIRNIS